MSDLRQEVAAVLEGGSAHAGLEKGLQGVPPALLGKRVTGSAHTLWQLAEHIRIAQWDILEFSRDPAHVSPAWPEGYWPQTPAPPSVSAWARCRKSIREDLAAMVALVRDPSRDLLAPLPHAPDKCLLREALLVADHNAYHLGQFIGLRQRLGAWRG